MRRGEFSGRILNVLRRSLVRSHPDGDQPKYYGKEAYINGYKLMIDTTCVKHIDVFSIADKTDKLISDGLYNIDELREKLGDVPLNTWWSRMHWMTKNYADIAKLPAAGGGEVNED